MNLLRPAQRLADLGWHTFALNPGGKPWGNCDDCRLTCQVGEDYEACACLLCHGFYAGTRYPSRLAQMWKDHEDSLIGVRTGAASELFVLDFDMHDGGKNGMETLERLKLADLLPLTVTALTGGGGVHLYYRHPGAPLRVPNDNRGKLGPGCDVKGDGGFVIAPPSIKAGKTRGYSWYAGRAPWEYDVASLSPQLLALITQVPVRLAQRTETTTPGIQVDLSALTLRELEQSLAKLEWVGVGGRNDRLYTAACRAGEAVASGALTLDEARALLIDKAAEAGLPLHEIHGTIRSGLNRGMRDFNVTI